MVSFPAVPVLGLAPADRNTECDLAQAAFDAKDGEFQSNLQRETGFHRTMTDQSDQDDNRSKAANAAEPQPLERPLPAAARRALAEAEARRAKQDAAAQGKPVEKEIGGRGGADPARFGDWEIDGRAIDF